MSAVYELAARDHRVAPTHRIDASKSAPTPSSFAYDVLQGLAQKHKSIPCTWLYDQRGSELFEAITRLDEYYPTRNEVLILERCAGEIARAAGPGATLIELGSGSSRKTRLLLGALESPAAYVPIDISAEFMLDAVQALRAEFAQLHIAPVGADFTGLVALPQLARLPAGGRRVVFFPGSTIGNFPPDVATALLQRIDQMAGPGALLVVGADATHDPAVLVPAYDDAQGVTAAFNKNLLVRINRELEGEFTPSAFRHEARWNAQEQRVEMHLVSEYTQRVRVRGRTFHFGMGESIHTENSYKYSLVRFQALARRAGWAHLQFWSDAQARFAVHVLERGAGGPWH